MTWFWYSAFLCLRDTLKHSPMSYITKGINTIITLYISGGLISFWKQGIFYSKVNYIHKKYYLLEYFSIFLLNSDFTFNVCHTDEYLSKWKSGFEHKLDLFLFKQTISIISKIGLIKVKLTLIVFSLIYLNINKLA